VRRGRLQPDGTESIIRSPRWRYSVSPACILNEGDSWIVLTSFQLRCTEMATIAEMRLIPPPSTRSHCGL